MLWTVMMNVVDLTVRDHLNFTSAKGFVGGTFIMTLQTAKLNLEISSLIEVVQAIVLCRCRLRVVVFCHM